MIRVEFHCHTQYSADSLVTPAQLVDACRKKGLDRVVVTDHNGIEGAILAREIDPVRVIVGEEIKTTQGELLAFYVQEKVPRGLSPMETIGILRDQGAFISVSHPFDSRRGWITGDLLALVPYIDAIETFNARCMTDEPNRQAQEFARQHDLLGTVGSDAHITWELGRAALILPEFSSPEGLKDAIRQAVPKVRLSGSWVHFLSTYARIKKEMDREKQARAEKKKQTGR